MRKSKFILLAVLSIGIATVSYANNLKIGFVDLATIIQKAPQVKTIDTQLKKEFAPRDAKIKADEKAMQKHVQVLKRNASVMSDKEKATAQKKLVEESEAIQQHRAQFEHDLQTAQTQAMKKLFLQISSIAKGVAKQDGYDVVLQKSAAIYYKPSLDTTTQVIKKLK